MRRIRNLSGQTARISTPALAEGGACSGRRTLANSLLTTKSLPKIALCRATQFSINVEVDRSTGGEPGRQTSLVGTHTYQGKALRTQPG